jgi:hypothetical protein
MSAPLFDERCRRTDAKAAKPLNLTAPRRYQVKDSTVKTSALRLIADRPGVHVDEAVEEVNDGSAQYPKQIANVLVDLLADEKVVIDGTAVCISPARDNWSACLRDGASD